MSDGYFNRSLLPHTEFKNGFRTAQTRTKILAVETFMEWMNECSIELSEEQKQAFAEEYSKRLEEKIK